MGVICECRKQNLSIRVCTWCYCLAH